MPRRALSALVLAAAGLAAVLAPMGATAGSMRETATPTALVWAPATLVFSGHGWGHGVGLSQYGAYGYAQHGYTYDQIVAHYFPGTDIEYSDSTTIRVLLASGRSSLTISSTAPFHGHRRGRHRHDVADLSAEPRPVAQRQRRRLGQRALWPGRSSSARERLRSPSRAAATAASSTSRSSEGSFV